MSDDLKAFLAAWLTWAEGEAQELTPFTRKYGLCSNVCYYCEVMFPGDYLRAERLEYALAKLLKITTGDTMYPFGKVQYATNVDSLTQHKDPQRLAWVRAQLEAVHA